MKEETMTFKVINDEGKEIDCEVLFTFESDETKKNYMVYTDNTKDENGSTKVYASVFVPEKEPLELLPVETEREWKVIETILESIQEENKKEKELKNLRDNLQVGDEIMTIGGFYGTVVRIKEDRITIASGAEKTKLEVSKSAVSTVLNREVPTAKQAKKADADEVEPDKVTPKKIKKLTKKEDADDFAE